MARPMVSTRRPTPIATSKGATRKASSSSRRNGIGARVMESVDLQVLATARNWASQGRHFALVTVARTWGSAPRPPGSWLVLRDDGLVEGSVSGGCIEDDLIARMRDG